ncbi:MAG: transglutaminase family protein [Methylococcaceae bacterium]
MSCLQIGCNLSYTVTRPSCFLFNIAAARSFQQIISQESLQLNPAVNYQSCYIGVEGSQVYRLSVEPCQLQLQYRARVNLFPSVQETNTIIETEYSQLPSEVLPYLNPSRYCESDRLNNFALRLFGNSQHGFSRVMAICDWIYNNLDYQAGSSNQSTSACEVLIERVGVCRDYAHLAIALCRALCIPARYISGYAVGLQPPDFHGFFEAFLGTRWYLFDATRLAPIEGFVRISTGRDAADAPFATIIGSASLTNMAVWAEQISPVPLFRS